VSGVISVPLRSKRQEKGLALQKVQHAVPAFGLMLAGTQAIRAGEHGFALALAVFEILTSAVLLVSMIRALRAARRPAVPPGAHAGHARVDWVEIFAGFVLVAEALERWHLKHHIARPTILTAILTFGLGLSHGRLAAFRARRRALRVDDSGIYVGGRPFGAFRATWDELSSIVIEKRYARIQTRTGRGRRLDLDDLEGPDEVRVALEGASRRLEELKGRAQGSLNG
jgi:hypothetical protein